MSWYQSSFRSVLKTYDCSALPVFSPGTMASTDFLQQALLRRFGFSLYFCVRKTSLNKSNNLCSTYLSHSQCKARAVFDFVLTYSFIRFALHHVQFLFVRPGVCPCQHFSVFTPSIFQILPHDGHPCLQLMAPTARSSVDFRHLVIAHSGLTRSSTGWTIPSGAAVSCPIRPLAAQAFHRQARRCLSDGTSCSWW